MNPLGVLTAADVAMPGEAAGDPVPRDMPVRDLMTRLSGSGEAALPVQGGGIVTRDSLMARLVNPQGHGGDTA